VRRKVEVWVTKKHRGKIARVKTMKIERVPVLPHMISQPRWRARHGKGAIVSGWLGSADGTALAGQTLRILTAPDNGQHQFTQAATATTNTRAAGPRSSRPARRGSSKPSTTAVRPSSRPSQRRST
jgi:hypothetical protein